MPSRRDPFKESAERFRNRDRSVIDAGAILPKGAKVFGGKKRAEEPVRDDFESPALLAEAEPSPESTLLPPSPISLSAHTAALPEESAKFTESDDFADPSEHLESATPAESAKIAHSAPASESANGRAKSLPMADSARGAESARYTESARRSDSAKIADPARVTEPTLVVRAKAGYLQLSYTVLDELLPQLDPQEAIVYLRLFRLSHGFKRDTCTVSAATLARTTRISERTVMRVVKDLEAKGLITRERPHFTGPHPGAGNVYRVHRPSEAPAKSADPDRSAESAKFADSARQADMKSLKKEKHESAPVAAAPAPLVLDKFEIRKKAARLWELHRTDPLYTHERLVNDVRSVLIADGHEIDEDLIAEATERMGA